MAVIMNFSAGQIFNLATLTWYKMAGKCALVVTLSALEKKTACLKSFKLSQNVAYSISFHIKKLNDTVITVRFPLKALTKMYLFSKMARLLTPQTSPTNLWQKKL